MSVVVKQIAARVKERGGRALLVGGCVRDEILGVPSKDVDMEVYGLNVDELKTVLSEFGTVNTVGASFGVFLINEVPGLDISVPRRDNRVGAGHRDFEVSMDPHMSIEDAARRRDFTMNSMAKDPLTGEIFDPFGGRQDLEKKILKMTDAELFGQDQLRALRAVQFCARFDLTPDTATANAIRGMSLADLPGERIFVEFEKMLNSPNPGYGLELLREFNLLRFFPELQALVGVPQEYEWHPEGWSLSEVSFNPRGTSAAMSSGVNNESSLREFLSGAFAFRARGKTSRHAAAAQSSSGRMDGIGHLDGLAPANETGSDNARATAALSPAVVTNSKGFVWTPGNQAVLANEVVRIMFKIPLSRVKTVVDRSINDLEILQGIVHPVAVFVMNMLPSFKWATQRDLHHNPVNPSPAGTALPRPANAHIPINAVEARATAVDDDIFFALDLALEGNGDSVHTRDCATIRHLCQVTVGDVWTHTLMAVHEAAALRSGNAEFDQVLMWATLCHDLGKATATEFIEGRWRSRGHESEGAAPTRALFARFGGVPQKLVERVVVIVENHLAPALYPEQGSGPSAYRRLARKLNAVGLTMRDLYDVSTADHFGRTTEEAIERRFPAGREFLAKAEAAGAGGPVYNDVVLGRHLLAIGVPPGKAMGEMLKKCREAQLEYGLTNVEEILEKIKEQTC